jgi:GntR family transcriptional regulator
MTLAMPLPKYHQIYLVLREQLQEGRFAKGLPGEMALVEQFGVARITVRKALERLQAEGLIDRRPGRGTVARLPTPQQGPGASEPHLTGLLENIVSMGLRTTVKVVSCDLVTASEAVARALSLPPGARVQKAVRVRSTREGPLSHITTHVPESLTLGFGRRELARKPLLVLLEEAGVQIGRASQTISARLADADTAHWLGVEVGCALLAVNRLVRDVNDRPVQWLQGLYRPDRYQYQMELSRVGDIDAKVWVSKELPAQYP